jgi:hypothetical protein
MLSEVDPLQPKALVAIEKSISIHLKCGRNLREYTVISIYEP